MNIEEFNNLKKEITSISLNNIFKKYTLNNNNYLSTVHVLRDINITLPLKSLSGLQGMTGCGKSTTGRILTGLLKPDSGELRVNNNGNKLILNNNIFRRLVRYVPQNPDSVLDPNISVKESLFEAIKYNRFGINEGKALFTKIKEFKLINETLLNRKLITLSLGERRRAVNIRSLLTNPLFMVLDEPFNGLDLLSKNIMTELLLFFRDTYNTGILVISHDMNIILNECHRIYKLENGHLY